MLLVLFLRESEISCFHSIGEEHIQERDDSINLGYIGCFCRLQKQKGQGHIHQVAEEAANDGGYAIPEGLTSQFFYLTQNFFRVLAKIVGIMVCVPILYLCS